MSYISGEALEVAMSILRQKLVGSNLYDKLVFCVSCGRYMTFLRSVEESLLGDSGKDWYLTFSCAECKISVKVSEYGMKDL